VNGKTERKGRARVLFYPKSDAVEAQQRQNGDDVSGTLVHIFTSLFSSPAATTTPQHGVVEQDGSPTNADDELQVSWLHADPVLSPKIDTKGEQNTVLRLPTRALHQPWTWVEGIDYRGDRRRYRVAPRSLACVMTCTHTCGSSRSK